VSGLETPNRGRIVLYGTDITGLPPHRVRRAGIAMVEQTPRTFESMRTATDVAVGAMFGSADGRRSERDALDRAHEALGFVGLAHRATDPVGALNLHEQRFLELARALASHPKLLLVDEVMAGLNDTELQSSIDIVRAARDELGVTVIWVEHVMKAVMSLAERVAVLDFGRILADGRPHDVMREPAVVNAYLGEAASHHA
jgi:branched-chain amino acid transport system permease protein